MTRTRPLLIVIFVFYADLAMAGCRTIPKQEVDAPIEYCESWQEIALRIGDDKRSYNRSDFIDGWRDLTSAWLKAEGLDPASIAGARVNFWLSVPEANPTAAQARVEIVPVSGQRFMLAGSPFFEEWDFPPHRDQVAVLRHGSYPDDFGVKAGVLLIKGQQDAAAEDVLDYLDSFAPEPSAASGGGWFEMPTVPLAEGQMAHELREDAKFYDYVAAIYYNSLYEWIALREKAFAFSW